MRWLTRGALLLLLAGGAVWVGRNTHPRATGTASPPLELASPPPPPPFARATAVREFHIPLDHGPHFDYETEWWYFTGNVIGDDGRPFGFQLTFFRRGLSPHPPPPARACARTRSTSRTWRSPTSRDGATSSSSAGAAGRRAWPAQPGSRSGSGSRTGGLTAWERTVARFAFGLRIGDSGIDLEIDATKPLVLHGDRGLSRKSAEPGNASYYIGYTRMTATGHVSVGGPPVAVRGTAWFDHEWSTSALGPGAVGWDWFSLQLGDERELMFFVIRREDGTAEPVSGGTLVETDGRTRRLGASEVTVEVLDRWTSPESGAVYPVRWRVVSEPASVDLEVDRRLDAQELRTSFTYWEGAVTLRGTSRGHAVAGAGYVEMTGYAASMHGVF